MRSRYTAFCRKDFAYLARTQSAPFDQANRDWALNARFLGLEVLSADESGDVGRVVFRARFVWQGVEQVHAEDSSFRRVEGRWVFVEGREP